MTVEELIEELQKFPLFYTVVFDVIGDEDTECQFNAEHGILSIILDIQPSISISDYEESEVKEE